jgi:mRNA interferase HigB
MADWVDGKVVFDIKNNEYRLIAIVAFAGGKLHIRHVMTHSEYEKGNWRQ